MTTKSGHLADVESIASGIWDMMPEDDQNVLSFGMIPKQWADLFEKQLKEKAEKLFPMLADTDEEKYPDLYAMVKEDVKEKRDVFFNEVNHAFVVAFLGMPKKHNCAYA